MDYQPVETEQSTGRALGDALRPLFRRMNSERSISLGKMGVLSRLANDGAATANALSAALHISPQAIALVVRELESLGLVIRTPDTADRRRLWLEITDEGRARLAFERGAGSGWLDEAVSENLSAAEQATLAAALPVLWKLGAAGPAHGPEATE